MTESYYTSLFRVWLDHEVLSRPEAKEYLVEMICEDTCRCPERVCEWLVDVLHSKNSVNDTHSRLIEHHEDIDYIGVSKALCEEYVIIV